MPSLQRLAESIRASFHGSASGGGDVTAFSHQLQGLSNRLDVLEEAVAADQEQSLHTLEAIMQSVTAKNGGSGVTLPRQTQQAYPVMGQLDDSMDAVVASPDAMSRASRRSGTPQQQRLNTTATSIPTRPLAGTGILAVKVSAQ